MLNFVLGTAVITAPQFGLPAVAIAAAAKGVNHLRNRGKAEQPLKTSSVAKLEEQLEQQLEAAVDPVLLEWSNVKCNLKLKGGETKPILRDVSGAARPGRLLAIMGPSGSGKTTLLTALAGQIPASSKMTLSGRLTVNDVPADAAGHKQAFVAQEDIFYSQLTVSETLTMAAELRLPQSMGAAHKAAYVDQLVSVLGLAKCKGTQVGDAKTRGLSGGEKKRLSIGCELVGSPSLIFLDEPTTGLDSFQAEKVMATIKGLAGSGHTVVCSIHQPRSSIFTMFDDLLLLADGQMVYCGAADKALDHFAALGHTCPEHYNPAEFVADLISVDFTSPESEEASRQRVQQLVQAWASAHPAGNGNGNGGKKEPLQKSGSAGDVAAAARRRAALLPPASLLKQLRLLFTRSWRQVTRDKATTIARTMANLTSALIFGAIFFRMKRGQSSVQDRLGLLQVAAINTAMSSLVKTLNVFPNERTIVQRERAKRSYATLPYLTAKLLAELPVGALFPLLFGGVVYPLTGLNPGLGRFAKFLGIVTLESFTGQALGLSVGAFAPSTEAAMAIGPAVMLVWIVFGGYYVNAGNVPGVLRWLPKASLIKQGFEGLCCNEFPGLEFEADANGGGMRDGKQVLQWLSFDEKGAVLKTCARQARITIFYYWATLCILQASKPRALAMKPEAEEQQQQQRQQLEAAHEAPEEQQPQQEQAAWEQQQQHPAAQQPAVKA